MNKSRVPFTLPAGATALALAFLVGCGGENAPPPTPAPKPAAPPAAAAPAAPAATETAAAPAGESAAAPAMGTPAAPAAGAPAGATAPPMPPVGDAAKQIFATRCATCHGTTGHGDGPAGLALNPRPRSYSDVAWQDSVTDEHIAKTIVEGGASVGKSPLMVPNPDLKDKPDVVKDLVRIVRSFRGAP